MTLFLGLSLFAVVVAAADGRRVQSEALREYTLLRLARLAR